MDKNKGHNGIALLLVVGILAVFTVTLTAFALNMQLEKTAAVNYVNTIKARYLSEAGIEYARAIARNNFKSTITDTLAERWASNYSLTFPNGSIQISIQDEQARVNINQANLLLLSNIPSIGPTLAANIIAYRTIEEAGFDTKEEVKNVTGIGSSKYSEIKDIITVKSYYNSNRDYRCPINVNTATQEVITAVLNGISDGTNTITALEAQNLTNELMTLRPFNSWIAFNTTIDTSGAINSAKKNMLKTLLNPYSKWPTPGPTNFTTEFCLFSGCFQVISNSTILNRAGNPVAQSRVEAVMALFSSINDAAFTATLKEDFRGEDANYNGVLDTGEDINANGSLDVPEYQKVTWMDSCPVNSTDDLGLTYRQDFAAYPDYGYQTVKDSLKIGFWDNFDENQDYSRDEWIRHDAAGDYTLGNDTTAPIPDADNEIILGGSFPVIDLMDTSKWNFSNFSIRAYVCDPDIPEATDPNVYERGWEDVSHLNFRRYGAIVYDNYVSCRGMWYFWNGFGWVPWPGFTPYDIYQPIHFLRLATEHRIDPYPALYNRQKTYKLLAQGANVTSYVYYANGSPNAPTLSANDATSSQGTISITGWWMFFPAWDDIRIISSNGSYTSISFNAGSQVEWGTVSGTVTTPSTANSTSETISFQTSTDSGASFLSPGAGGAILQSPSQTIQYRANLNTNDSDLSETPVLEDVTVTFLKPNTVKTVYYKQIIE
jgi:competence ComEA-like helix-hairpin-helix protein